MNILTLRHLTENMRKLPHREFTFTVIRKQMIVWLVLNGTNSHGHSNLNFVTLPFDLLTVKLSHRVFSKKGQDTILVDCRLLD